MMHFTFTETGVILDETEVCKFLEGWSIFVTPNKLKSAFFKTPGGDFFEILKQGPWRYDTEEVEKEFFDKIQEAAKGIGFKTTPRMAKKLMRLRACSISGALQAVHDTASGLHALGLG